MYVESCGLWTTWLDKYLKTLVSEHFSTVNILKSAKHCWNLYNFIFIIFFHQSQENIVGQCLSE